MNNTILINQARQLHAELLAKNVKPTEEKIIGLKQLDRAIIRAYCRYKRRLDQSIIHHQQSDHDCILEIGKKRPASTPGKSSQISKLAKFKYALSS